jgi:ribA/ribD-fused uncharacterized protein
MNTKGQVIDNFVGNYRFLSNFYPDNNQTLEHEYQAAKTNNVIWKRRILTAPTPNLAKKLGKRAPLRNDWEAIKIPTMRYLLSLKFNSMSEETIKLLETEDRKLIEGNTWGDKFWGMCFENNELVDQNWLGFLLMGRRAELRNLIP